MKKAMLKRLAAIVLSIGMTGALLTGCGGSGSPAPNNSGASADKESSIPSQTYVIKMGHVLATTHPVHIAMTEAAEQIAQRTNGGVELQIYPNGELSSYQDGVEAVRTGAPFLFFSSPGQFSDYVPDMAALQAPFLYSTFEEYSNLMDTDVIKDLKAQAETQKIKVLSLNFVSGFRHILTDKAITDVSDLKNLKIRVPGNPVFVQPFEAMGTNPSSIAWSETYQALQQGVVDSIEGTVGNIYDAKMFELKKEITRTAHLIDMSGIFIGMDFWNTIPEEYQAIIQEEIDAAAERQNAAAKQIEEDYVGMLEEAGVTFHDVDKTSFIEATKDIVLQYDIGQSLVDTVAEVNG